MFLSYEQIEATSAVKTASDLNIPARATHVALQADTQNIRYTMDNHSDPSQTSGMILLTTQAPELFLIEDLRRIRFTRGAGSDAKLNVHYVGGRDV